MCCDYKIYASLLPFSLISKSCVLYNIFYSHFILHDVRSVRKTTVINREKLVEMFVVPLLELVLVLLTYKIVTASQTRSAICHQNQRSAAHKRAGKKRKAIVCVTTIKLISKNDRLPPSSLSTYGSVIYLPLTGAIVT